MVWKPDYITGAQLGDYLGIDDADEYSQEDLADWATTASRDIDHACGRQFGRSDDVITREYDMIGDRYLGGYFAYIDDLFDVTGLVITLAGRTLVADDDYELRPRNAPADGRVYTRIRTRGPGLLRITSDRFGWPAVPAAIRTAAKLQGARLASRVGSPMGIAGSPQLEGGGETRLLASLDPDVRTSIKHYVRKWWAA